MTLPIPAWFWFGIWAINLLGADNWGDAGVAAGMIVFGILLGRVSGPHRSEGRRATVGADGTSEPQGPHHIGGGR